MIDPEAALGADAPLLHEEAGTNVLVDARVRARRCRRGHGGGAGPGRRRVSGFTARRRWRSRTVPISRNTIAAAAR